MATKTAKSRKPATPPAPGPRTAPDDTTGPDLMDGGLRGQKRIAARFVRRFSGRYIYTAGREWLEWTGSHWTVCDDAGPWRAVGTVCREALRDLPELDKDARDGLYADIRTCDSERGTAGVLAHVKRAAGIRVRDDQLDARPELIAFTNGTFDLEKGEFRDADPRDLLTLIAGCDYDPAAECPLYDSLMDQYQTDDEVQAYLHRLGGAAMEGRQNLQHLVTWYGATGGNGKGTIMRAWQHVFGSYARVLPVEALLARRGSAADAYRDQKAGLQGVRLVFATEPSDGARFDTGTVKSLTGGDRVSARAMYKATVEFDPTWLIVMPTNTRVITPNDGGMARRLKEISWGFRVQPDQMRDDLDGLLQAEASGILNRLLIGWFDYRDHGIQHPASVEESTAEYLAEVDPLRQFIDAHVVVDEAGRTQGSQLYARYRSWCEDEGNTPWSSSVFAPRFARALESEGVEKKKINGLSTWKGVRLDM